MLVAPADTVLVSAPSIYEVLLAPVIDPFAGTVREYEPVVKRPLLKESVPAEPIVTFPPHETPAELLIVRLLKLNTGIV